MRPELDIVVNAVASGDATSASNNARNTFARASERQLHLAMVELPVKLVQAYLPELQSNADTVTCLRSVLMKPERSSQALCTCIAARVITIPT